jgi:VanZ family protein
MHRPAERPLGWSNLAIILLLLAAYGSFDEITQRLVGRRCEFGDWLADMAGAMLGLAAQSLSFRFFRRPRSEAYQLS